MRPQKRQIEMDIVTDDRAIFQKSREGRQNLLDIGCIFPTLFAKTIDRSCDRSDSTGISGLDLALPVFNLDLLLEVSFNDNADLQDLVCVRIQASCLKVEKYEASRVSSADTFEDQLFFDVSHD